LTAWGDKGVLLLVGVGGQGGEVSVGVSAQEVEDAVPPGVDAGGEGGPGHWGLGRVGGLEPGVAPLLP
jgi:hypothetical protein